MNLQKAKTKRIFLLMYQEKFIANKPITLDNATLYRYRGGCTHGYIINKAAAQSYSDCMYPIKLVADDWQYLNFASNIKIYAVIPYPTVIAGDIASNIESDRHDKSNKKRAYRKALFYRNPKLLLRTIIYRYFIRPFLKIKHP